MQYICLVKLYMTVIESMLINETRRLTHTHTHTHTYTCTHILTHIHMHTYTYTHIYTKLICSVELINHSLHILRLEWTLWMQVSQQWTEQPTGRDRLAHS